jgi:hypothetical protein
MKSFRAIFASCAILAAGLAIVAESQTTPPAPTVDRVFFPADYQNWQVLYTIDRPDNKQQRVIYGNDLAAAVIRGGEWDYPQGSILVMETWPTVKDDQGNPVLDENGRFVKMGDTYAGTVFVSRKGPGLGVDYGPNRNGDWAYTAYHTDGTFQTVPQNTFSCAACHLQVGTGTDFVFHNTLHTNGASGALPNNVILNYKFVGENTVKVGQTYTVYNQDVLTHTFVLDDGSVSSGSITPGASFAFLPAKPGTYKYHCAIHPAMTGTITAQ